MGDDPAIMDHLNCFVGKIAKPYKLRVSLSSKLCAKLISFGNHPNGHAKSNLVNDRDEESSESSSVIF